MPAVQENLSIPPPNESNRSVEETWFQNATYKLSVHINTKVCKHIGLYIHTKRVRMGLKLDLV